MTPSTTTIAATAQSKDHEDTRIPRARWNGGGWTRCYREYLDPDYHPQERPLDYGGRERGRVPNAAFRAR